MDDANFLLFYFATIASLLVLVAICVALHWSKWTLIVAYLFAPLCGFKCIGWYLKRKPDARYLTPDKVDGMGYVWAPLDVLMPYLIQGIIILWMFLFLSRKH